MQKKKKIQSNIELGTLKNHNNKLKPEIEKTTNKDKEKTNKQMMRKTYPIKKCCGFSPRKVPNFNLQNEKVEK
jgi:hypothetical protein